jgi:hypothetical protein
VDVVEGPFALDGLEIPSGKIEDICIDSPLMARDTARRNPTPALAQHCNISGSFMSAG